MLRMKQWAWILPLALATGCNGGEGVLDASTDVPTDLGMPDAADVAPRPDASMDATQPDAEVPDAEAPDAEAPDTMLPDSGTPDADSPDAMLPDTGAPDTGTPDSGTPDTGTPDSGTPDGGPPPNCPGAIAVLNCDSGTVTGTTAGRPDSYDVYTCFGDPGDYTGRDAVYVFESDVATDVTIVATGSGSSGDYDLMVLDGANACGPSNACIAPSINYGNNEYVRFGVGAGQRVYVAYDVYDSPSSTTNFTLQITCTPAVCGDGVANGLEQCDDGNTISGDGCSSTCTLEGASLPIPPVGRTLGLGGRLGASDSTWVRPDTNCSRSSFERVLYRAFTIRNTDTVSHTVSVSASWNDVGSLYLYGTPFQPMSPLSQCLLGDYDFAPDVTSFSGIFLAPGEERVLVISDTYEDWNAGPFRLTVRTGS
jgi:cysteine-rich repeat protein